MRWLIFGHKGWIGQQVVQILNKQGEKVIGSDARADNEEAVELELVHHKPDRVVSLIGRTRGGDYNTIEYLEQKGKLVENVRDNLYAPVTLAILCKKYNIHYTYLGTGCIFNGYPESGYTEESVPDFTGSAYSTVKGFTDRLMHQFNDTALNVRIRMPITPDLHPNNFITKILSYKKIINIPNSMTVLPDLLPVMIDMARNQSTGTINLTNPGLISHNEIMEMYREIVDPTLTWENFELDDMYKTISSQRSNNHLNTLKLENLYPMTKSIHESVQEMMYEIKKIKQEQKC